MQWHTWTTFTCVQSPCETDTEMWLKVELNERSCRACTVLLTDEEWGSNAIWEQIQVYRDGLVWAAFSHSWWEVCVRKNPRQNNSTDIKSFYTLCWKEIFFFFSLEAIKLQTPHQREAKIIQGFLHLCQTTLADHRGLNKSASDKLTDMMTD